MRNLWIWGIYLVLVRKFNLSIEIFVNIMITKMTFKCREFLATHSYTTTHIKVSYRFYYRQIAQFPSGPIFVSQLLKSSHNMSCNFRNTWKHFSNQLNQQFVLLTSYWHLWGKKKRKKVFHPPVFLSKREKLQVWALK